MRVRTVEKITDAWAICHGCDWESEAKAAKAVGKRHAEKTGHFVTVDTTRTTTYGHKRGPGVQS